MSIGGSTRAIGLGLDINARCAICGGRLIGSINFTMVGGVLFRVSRVGGVGFFMIVNGVQGGDITMTFLCGNGLLTYHHVFQD